MLYNVFIRAIVSISSFANILTIVLINIHYLFYIILDYCFLKPIYSTLKKQHAFESYFSIWIILHSSQDRNQPTVNYEDRMKSFLTHGNCESAMETFSIVLFENGTFCLISRDHNQPIERPEFNEVLYKNTDMICQNVFIIS